VEWIEAEGRVDDSNFPSATHHLPKHPRSHVNRPLPLGAPPQGPQLTWTIPPKSMVCASLFPSITTFIARVDKLSGLGGGGGLSGEKEV